MPSTLTTPAQAVFDDHGEIGKGASRAHHVSAENGAEFIIKGPSFTPEHPTVAANEWIAARLAEKLGLPILPFQLMTMRGELFFGSLWMPSGATWHDGISADLFARCENQNRVYDVIVLDTWLINPDRHHQNLIVRVLRGGQHTLLLNDHSHLLVSPSGPQKTEDLMDCLDHLPGRFVRLALIRDNIADTAHLSDSLDRAEGLSDADVRGIVESTPSEFLSGDARQSYAEFLVRRRLRLRELFKSDLAAFPRLAKGSL